MGPIRSASVVEKGVVDWEGLVARVKGPCGGCPRNGSKSPVLFDHKGSLGGVEFIIVSQEPGFWLNAFPAKKEESLAELCKTGKKNTPECKQANPLSKVLEIFDNFDPSTSSIYWTHALKCVPSKGDRDINKEWRRAATRCTDMFLEEMRVLGKAELNIVAFGKYALELCLNVLDGQDLDQELSISEFMQSNRLPLSYKIKFKDGTNKRVTLFVFTNPSNDTVKINKSGGRMTVEEIQEIESKRIQEIFSQKRR